MSVRTLTTLVLLLPAALAAQGELKPSAQRAKRALQEVLQPSEAELSQRVTPVVRAVRATADSVFSVLIYSPVRRGPFGQQAGGLEGQGSGVIIDEKGLALTNWHVVARATADRSRKVNVKLKSGKTYAARVVSTAPEFDLALIQLQLPDDERVDPVTMGDSDSLMIGETVIAIGNPKGHANTVTVGVLSAENREITVRAPDGQIRKYQGLLQTDAAINQGNSGGALLDITGKLIGINNAIAPDSENIGFAIPVNTVRRVFNEVLLNSDHLTAVYLGMKVVDRGTAAVLADVTQGGPAFRAGLRAGDELRAVGRDPVRSTLDYARTILGAEPGRPVSITVRRGGRELTREAMPMSSAAWAVERRIGLEFEVVTARQDERLLTTATQQFYRELGKYARGVLPAVLRVTRVRESSPASELGIRQGDVLLGIVDRVPDMFGTSNVVNRFDDVARLNDALHVMSLRSRDPSYKVWILRDGDVLEGDLEIPRM